jgi:hypothetical protein
MAVILGLMALFCRKSRRYAVPVGFAQPNAEGGVTMV